MCTCGYQNKVSCRVTQIVYYYLYFVTVFGAAWVHDQGPSVCTMVQCILGRARLVFVCSELGSSCPCSFLATVLGHVHTNGPIYGKALLVSWLWLGGEGPHASRTHFARTHIHPPRT